MKKITLCIMLLLSSMAIVKAQDQKEQNQYNKAQKMQALYIAYITRELQLNEMEAQRFWPLHNQFDVELKSITLRNLPELEKEEASLKVKKSYKDRFAKIIGESRTDDFYRKDAEFRRKLVEKLRDHQQGKNTNRPNKKYRQL